MVRDLTPERAEELFRGGYNCAQAVLLAFADRTGAEQTFLENIAKPMGGGMGRLRLTCGAVSGGAMALGLLFPEETKSGIYALVQKLAARFAERNGSVICADLLSGAHLKADTSPAAEARTPEYYKKRPCAELVRDAAMIVEELLEENGR